MSIDVTALDERSAPLVTIPLVTPAGGTSVEVLIVSYNTRALLAQTIATLLEHLPSRATASVAIAVFDNASSDGSADMVAARFPAVRLVRSDTNIGFAAGNNALAQTSEATYLLLLNSDVILTEDIISRLLAALEADAMAVIAGPRITFPDGTLQPSSQHLPTLRYELARALHKTRIGLAMRSIFDTGRIIATCRQEELHESRESRRTAFLWATCWLIHRDEVVRHGLFDERYTTYDEDLDFCHRLQRRGRTALYVPGVELVHLGGASSSTSAKELMMREGRSRYFRDHRGFVTSLLYRHAVVGLTMLKERKWVARAE